MQLVSWDVRKTNHIHVDPVLYEKQNNWKKTMAVTKLKSSVHL